MKVCKCSFEYDEDFNYCPRCGEKFGGQSKEELERKLNQHLFDMKRQAGAEAALSRRVFSKQGLGDVNLGRIYGGKSQSDSDL